MGAKKDSRLTKAGVSGYNNLNVHLNTRKNLMSLLLKLETQLKQSALDNKALVGLVKVQRQQPVKLDVEALKQDMLQILQRES